MKIKEIWFNWVQGGNLEEGLGEAVKNAVLKSKNKLSKRST